METLQDRLRARLNELGRGAMSDMARYIGTTPQTVRSWVKEGVNPGEDSLAKAASFLKVTPQWLRYGDTKPTVAPAAPAPVLEYLLEDEHLLIQNYRRCTDAGKAQLLTSSRAAEKKPIEQVLTDARTSTNKKS